MKAAVHLAALAALACCLVACQRQEQQAAAPAPAAPAASAASAPVPAAAASGPVIAPVAIAEPTDAQRQAGATLAAQGANGVAACNGCHGANGEGNAATGFPRVAGQTHAYLLHELQAYAEGSRKNPVMQPIATAMSADQRVSAAAHYASLNPAGGPATAMAGAPAASGAAAPASGAASASSASAAPAPSAAQVASSAPAASSSLAAASATTGKSSAAAGKAAGGRGQQLAELGDEALGIQGCANCHGPGGIGSGEFYPYLAGQHSGYLTATLGAWKDGSRNDDPTGQMPIIARALSPQDIQALAAYYGGQPPRPGAMDAETMTVARTGTATAIVSGPRSATPAATASPAAAPAAGTGTEQGAPLTGGSQGPGGGGGTNAASTGNPAATTTPQPPTVPASAR